MFDFEHPASKNEHLTPHTTSLSPENHNVNKWHRFSGQVHFHQTVAHVYQLSKNCL